jgi:cyclopropane fatty-acyl-phospholipid synthase-like methyltransferase
MSTPEEIFNRYANAYQERFMDLDLYNDTYDALNSLLKPNAKVLEVGCGPANISRYLLSKRPDLKITGIDIAENMIDLAKQNCPSASFEIIDCRDISSFNEKFDVVICGFCIPYLNMEEVMKLISDSRKLLSDHGVLYLSVIEDSYEKSSYQKSSDGKDGCMIYFYTEADLRAILTENKFEEPLIFRKQFGESTHLVMIASQ